MQFTLDVVRTLVNEGRQQRQQRPWWVIIKIPKKLTHSKPVSSAALSVTKPNMTNEFLSLDWNLKS